MKGVSNLWLVSIQGLCDIYSLSPVTIHLNKSPCSLSCIKKVNTLSHHFILYSFDCIFGTGMHIISTSSVSHTQFHEKINMSWNCMESDINSQSSVLFNYTHILFFTKDGHLLWSLVSYIFASFVKKSHSSPHIHLWVKHLSLSINLKI